MSINNSIKYCLIPVLLFVFLFLFTLNADAQPRAYIPNLNDNTVTVIDTGTNTIVATIEDGIGERPLSVAITPDGTKVYVTNNDTPGTVSVIQASTNTVIDTISVGSGPSGITITPDGNFAYVTNSNSFNISKINLATDTVVATIPTPGLNPGRLVPTPDGAFIYVLVTNTSQRLFRIRTSDDTVVGPTLMGFGNGTFMDISPDGEKLYITVNNVLTADVVQIVDIAMDGTPSLGPTIPLQLNDCSLRPSFVAVHPDGDEAWVSTLPTAVPFGSCPPSDPFHVELVTINTANDAAVYINGIPDTFNRFAFTRDGATFFGLNTMGLGRTSPAEFPLVFSPTFPYGSSGIPLSPYFIGPDLFDLTIDKTGNGGGTVTGTPAGIDCGSTCTAFFPENTVVDLSAVPDANSLFTGWSEDCSGTDPDTMINVMTTSLCEAMFTLIQFNVNINITGSGSGSVTTSPTGIDCPSTCSAMFDVGDDITLNTNPASGSEFISWSGDPNCNDGVIDNLSGDISCTATFNDIDDCIPNPCMNGGTCMDTGPNSFSCDCAGTGFEGPTCNIDIDECADPALNNCSTNATCTNIPGGFTCECNPGFTGNGISCIEIIGCGPPNPCQNGGICTDTGVNEINCECQDDFTGNRCQFSEDSSVIILPGTGTIFSEIIFGSDINGGAEVLIDLPEDVFARTAELIPGIGGCEIIDPLVTARVSNPDVVCDVANVPGELDVILDLCRDGSSEGTVQAIVGVVLDEDPQEEFETFIDILLSELEACSGGDDGSDDGGDDGSDSTDNSNAGCSLTSGTLNIESGIGNLLIILIPFMLGMIKTIRRSRIL